MSLQKRDIAKEIAEKQIQLSQIVEQIKQHDHECDDGRDFVHSLRLKSVVLESEIDQLQKQFVRI